MRFYLFEALSKNPHSGQSERVRRITQPLYPLSIREELGGCSWVIQPTLYRKAPEDNSMLEKRRCRRDAARQATARPVSYGKRYTASILILTWQ
jgi:hypothetical protein